MSGRAKRTLANVARSWQRLSMSPSNRSDEHHGLKRQNGIVLGTGVAGAWLILLSSVAALAGCGAQTSDSSESSAVPVPNPPVSATSPSAEGSSDAYGERGAQCTALQRLGESDDAVAGIERCARDYIVRDISTGCQGGGAGELAYTEGSAECDTDSDCPPEARCLGSKPYTWCRYAGVCTDNSDCPSGNACFCALDVSPEGSILQEVNTCLPAECETSADCGGFPCVASRHHCFAGFQGSFCHGSADECQSSNDCEGSSYCRYNLEEARWHCQSFHTCR